MIETKRLYYDDAYINEFTATVLECREEQNGYGILLDQSAFYPEGGGQPSDRGQIDGTEVVDVKEKCGELIHFTKEPVEKGRKVSGNIDWKRRFDLMQQHSGEHMVSGLIHEKYGYDNVGFHMGSDIVTIDFNGPLTMEELLAIEQKVNQKVWENTNVEIWYPSAQELDSLPYRSKKELTGKIRIVRFPGADLCACCGTHVKQTGEIGIIKILSCEKFREGVRVEMVSGRRVLEHLNMLQEQNHQISVLLSAKPSCTANAVSRLYEENFSLKGRVMQMEEKYFREEADKWSGKGDVLLVCSEMETESVRRLADAVMHTCGGRCAVFAGDDKNGYKYAMGQENGDLRDLTKEMNQTLQGRGGGKPFFVQGSVKSTEQEIRKFFC